MSEPAPSDPATARGPAAGGEPPLPPHTVRRTRASAAWTGVIGFAIVLLLLIIFIAENSARATISFFGAHGRLSLGLALLLAAVLGALLVAIPGGVRMVQLRRAARLHRRAETPGRSVDAAQT
jgi:uncharacterized integral membrane protein